MQQIKITTALDPAVGATAEQSSVNMYAERHIASYPEGTRYRPWETAINIDAMLKFAAYYAARKHFN